MTGPITCTILPTFCCLVAMCFTFSHARGAPPPLALTRRPGSAGLPSGASLGPQALSYARGAPPPLALTRRPGCAGLPSGASLGPQALQRLCHKYGLKLVNKCELNAELAELTEKCNHEDTKSTSAFFVS